MHKFGETCIVNSRLMCNFRCMVCDVEVKQVSLRGRDLKNNDIFMIVYNRKAIASISRISEGLHDEIV